MFIPITARKFLRNYKDFGPGVALSKVVTGLGAFLYESRTYRIYRIRLDRFEPRKPATSGLQLRMLKPEEEDLICQIEGMEEWLFGKVTRKLKSGSICLVALDSGLVAGFNLVSFGEVYMPLVHKTRRFRDNEAWSEQISVNRNYRKRGLASSLRLTIFSVLRARGINRFYGGTLPGNKANLRLCRNVGLEVIADIKYRKCLHSRNWKTTRIDRSSEKPS